MSTRDEFSENDATINVVRELVIQLMQESSEHTGSACAKCGSRFNPYDKFSVVAGLNLGTFLMHPICVPCDVESTDEATLFQQAMIGFIQRERDRLEAEGLTR